MSTISYTKDHPLVPEFRSIVVEFEGYKATGEALSGATITQLAGRVFAAIKRYSLLTPDLQRVIVVPRILLSLYAECDSMFDESVGNGVKLSMDFDSIHSGDPRIQEYSYLQWEYFGSGRLTPDRELAPEPAIPPIEIVPSVLSASLMPDTHTITSPASTITPALTHSVLQSLLPESVPLGVQEAAPEHDKKKDLSVRHVKVKVSHPNHTSNIALEPVLDNKVVTPEQRLRPGQALEPACNRCIKKGVKCVSAATGNCCDHCTTTHLKCLFARQKPGGGKVTVEGVAAGSNARDIVELGGRVVKVKSNAVVEGDVAGSKKRKLVEPVKHEDPKAAVVGSKRRRTVEPAGATVKEETKTRPRRAKSSLPPPEGVALSGGQGTRTRRRAEKLADGVTEAVTDKDSPMEGVINGKVLKGDVVKGIVSGETLKKGEGLTGASTTITGDNPPPTCSPSMTAYDRFDGRLRELEERWTAERKDLLEQVTTLRQDIISLRQENARVTAAMSASRLKQNFDELERKYDSLLMYVKSLEGQNPTGQIPVAQPPAQPPPHTGQLLTGHPDPLAPSGQLLSTEPPVSLVSSTYSPVGTPSLFLYQRPLLLTSTHPGGASRHGSPLFRELDASSSRGNTPGGSVQ